MSDQIRKATMTTRHFPVLLTPADWKRYPDCPASIPWNLIALHEEQALRNHRQSLADLARRGGLSPLEMKAVLEGRRYGPPADRAAEMAAAVEYLKDLISQHERLPMHRHELDEATDAFVTELQNQLPPHLTQFARANPDQLRELARPHVEQIAAAHAAAPEGAAAAKKPFNLAKFLENAKPIIALVVSLLGSFGGVPGAAPTAGAAPAAGAPAPAQAQKTEGQTGGATPGQPANP
jgi:hypothetical protein